MNIISELVKKRKKCYQRITDQKHIINNIRLT